MPRPLSYQSFVHSEEHMGFIIDRVLYWYKVISFKLQNVGATYQRMVNKMLEAQIKNIWHMDACINLKIKFDLIYDSYIRCMIIYQSLKFSLNLIYELHMRYMISFQDLNLV